LITADSFISARTTTWELVFSVEAFPLSGLALHLPVPSPLSSPKSTLGDLDVSPHACTRAASPDRINAILTLSI
jgi:hypothetical protein